MANDNFEKRMEFLKKSYERVPTSFDPDEVFKKIEQEEALRPTEKKKQSKHGIRQHITVWAMSIASVFLIGLIGAGYLADQRNSKEEIIDSVELDDYIEELKAKYEVEKEKRREMLKLDEEHFELYAGSSSMSLLDMESFIKGAKKNSNAKEIVLQQYSRAIEQLKLPSEMIQDLKSNPLTEDEAGSIEFIATYRAKVNKLIAIYDQIVDENREAIREFEVSPSVDKAEIMMLTSKSFPEQLQNIINTMKEQSIRLDTGKYSGEIESRYYESLLHRELDANLHTYTFGYRQMLINGPYMYGGILEHPLLQSSSMIQNMEYTLMNVEQDSTLYPVLKSYYITLFNEIMKGSEYTKLFDAEGVLLPEYQEAWRNMAVGGEATPLRYILNPIIKEMESSGWRESSSWAALDYYDLDEALVLYREGLLEEYMYGERPDFKTESVQLPDSKFDEKVQALYVDFKKAYDKSVLKEATPIEVLAVFDYANEMDDPTTMYHLLNENAKYDESGEEPTLSRYVNYWRKSVSLFRNATEARFDSGSVSRYDQMFNGSVYFAGSEKSISMVYNKEGIWEVGFNRFEQLPSYHRSEERNFINDMNEWAAYYYEGLVSTNDVDDYLRWQAPLDIIYMFLYAGQKGFFEEQYKLYYQGEGSSVIDKETYVKNPEKYFAPEFDNELFKTVSFQGQKYDEEGGFYPGIATFTVNKEKYPDEASTMEFHMIWTEKGWRVKFDPFNK